MSLEFNGDVWVDTGTGEYYTQKQIEALSDEKFKKDHREYIQRSMEYGTKSKLRVSEVPNKEPSLGKVKDGYKFNMIHRTDMKKIMMSRKLKSKEIAFIGGLTPFISYPDNDVKVDNQYLTLEEIGKLIDCGINRMTKLIKVLEDEEIIKVVKGGNKPPRYLF